MDAKRVQHYIGKKVMIILKNNFQYICVIPPFNNNSFVIEDKFGYEVEIECDYVASIRVLKIREDEDESN